MSTTQIADFFAWRFADLRPAERIEIRSFPRGGGQTRQSWHKTPAAAARAVLALPADHDPYYGVNARRDQGAKKEDVTQVRGLWADQDFKHYPDGAAGAAAALAAFPLQPTAVVESGNGYHLYWQLAAPIEPTAAVEQLLLRLYAFLGGVDGPLDSVQDLPRVLRVPFTRNHKSNPPRPVTLKVADTGARYTLDDFEWILPAPAPQPRPTWTPPTERATRATNHDAPTHDDVREWLRFTPPQRTYKEWLTTLAAVHSIFPGGDGIALCEEWSAGKPGEVAEKFASFKRPNGASNTAGVGTLVHTAKQNGWAPPRQTETTAAGTSPDYQRLLAERDARIVALEADIQRLGDALRREQAEGAQLVTRITALETENAALDAAMRHPDQAAGVGALDLLDAANRAYSKGDVLTRDGKDYARVPFSKAEDRRSAKTNARGFKAIQEAGKIDAFTRTERIETPTYKGDVPIAYIYVSPGLRERRGAAVLSILPTPTEKKHGGRRTIAVPAEVAAQPHPVKRERELVTRWYDALSDEKLVTEAPARLGTDYWTAQGEQRTREEVEALRVQAGYQPAPAKPWQPTQPPLRIVPAPEPRQDAEVSADHPDQQRIKPRQDADIDTKDLCRQDAEVFSDGCPDCGQPIAIGGYCMTHFMRHRDTNRHRAEARCGAYAAGD